LKTIKVGGVNFYNGDIISLVNNVIDLISINPHQNYCISATGAHGVVETRKQLSFKKVLNSFYLNMPDGMPIVWVGRIKGAKEIRRCYGPDFFKSLIFKTSSLPINHFFCGGNEGVAEELKVVCNQQYNNQNIVGTFCPPFREMTELELKELAQQINQTKANIVWIGLSSPKQEVFASKLREYVNCDFLITVGAAFDFHTGKVKQAPRWVQKIGMEWFFRLSMEPKRLYKRYFEIVPVFIWLNIKEFVDFYIFKKKSV